MFDLLPRCLMADEIGASASSGLLCSTPPDTDGPSNHNCTLRTLTLRNCSSPDVTSCNISNPVSGSSLNKKVAFIESLPVRPKLRHPLAARLGVYCVLLCKNCVAVCASYPRPTLFSRRDSCKCIRTCRRHNRHVCGFEHGRQC